MKEEEICKPTQNSSMQIITATQGTVSQKVTQHSIKDAPLKTRPDETKLTY